MSIRLLGTVELLDSEDTAIEIGGAQPRVILALLAAAGGRLVTADALIDAIWDDAPPPSATGTLQTYVSRLRRALAEVGGSIVHTRGGYRLECDGAAIDVRRFEALADQGRSALNAADPAAARALLIEAEGLWRGPALLEVRERPRIAGIARRLDDRRLAALEDRLTADLALGRHAVVVPELAQLVSEHPLRERLWELLALARYRSGLQADALQAISDARETLIDALGVEPGAGLRSLTQAILRQDPELDYVPALADASVPPGGAAPRRLAEIPRPEAIPDPRPAPPQPLIGRERELAPLTAALDEVSAGRAAVAVVQGEAGVGKTRLVEEVVTMAGRRGSFVVWGRSLEGDAAPAYWPWIDALRTLRAAHPRDSSEVIDQLLDATGTPGVAPAVARSHLLDGVLRYLRRAPDAGDHPLVVVLEDVQWADVESLELTTQLTSALADEPVLLILTLRDGDDARRKEVTALLAAASRRSSTRRLRLDGLDPAATAALLARVSGRPVDDEFARVVHERVEGNPFYAIELQRLLDAEGVIDATSIARVAVPVGIRDVVRQRLTRLPEPTLALLHLAAVAGRDLDVEVVSLASGLSIDQCVDQLEVAFDHRLLTDTGPHAGVRFSHALVREVIADELSALRRARAHLALADALIAAGRADDHAEILAEHLWAAVPIGAGRRAADALERAADVAIARFAVGAASGLLARSLELRRSQGADPAAELDTLIKLVWTLRARSGYQGGLEHYRRGTELAHQLGRHDIELEMQWAEWAGYDTACDFDRARPAAVRFRSRAASSDDPVVKLAGNTAWAIQSWHDGDLAESAAMFALATGAGTPLEPDGGTVSLIAELLVLSAAFGLYIEEQSGRLADPDDAFAAAAEAVSGNFPVAILWSLACTSATSAGDLERVKRYSRLVLDAEAGETLGFWGSQARMYLGAALIASGCPGEGRELFDAGRRGYAEAGVNTGLALMLAAAASAEVIAGDLGRAAAHLKAAEQELTRGERWPAPFVLLAAADVAEASGTPAGEVQLLRAQAETVARAQGAVVAAARARAAAHGERWSARRSVAQD